MNQLMMNIVGGMLQNKLQQAGFNTQWVNFNDINSVGNFAKQIIPWILKGNPQMKDYIKNNVPQENKEEVVQIIDNI